MDGWGWSWGWGMAVLHGLLWWVILILGIVVLVRLLSGGARRAGPASPAPETALEILKKRYARGEIGRDEFEEKKRDLA
jgi:putative membrane protein